MIVMYSLKLTVYYFFSVEKLWFYVKLSFDYLFFKFQIQTLCNKIDVRPSNISVKTFRSRSILRVNCNIFWYASGD